MADLKNHCFTNETLREAVKSFLDNKTIAEQIYGPIGSWDVSKVTCMKGLFSNSANFNEDISGWDVSSVESMTDMFAMAANFNKPLNAWNVSKVKDMQAMFYKAVNFNQPLDNWDTSSVTNMESMFYVVDLLMSFNLNIISRVVS